MLTQRTFRTCQGTEHFPQHGVQCSSKVFLYNYHIGTHSFPAFGKHACSLGQHLRPVAGIPTVNVFLYNYHIGTHFGYCTKQKLSNTGRHR
jgi:hypothetical protein